MMLPSLDVRVVRWERKYLIEKDEEYNPVLKNGKPIIMDAWVLVTVTRGGNEFIVEFSEPDFDKNILPNVLDPLIRYWRAIDVGEASFGQREEMLAFLLEQKALYPELCEP